MLKRLSFRAAKQCLFFMDVIDTMYQFRSGAFKALIAARNKRGILVTLVLSLLFVGACNSVVTSQAKSSTLVATIYPLQYFASQVGSGRVEVTGLVPTGVEPHEWEPSSKDITAIKRAKVFVYNGAGLEPWVDRVLEEFGDSSGPVAVDSSDGVKLLQAVHDEDEDEKSHKEKEIGFDPHVWLDPLRAQQQVKNIADALARADADNQNIYSENGNALNGRLQELHQAYSSGLRSCQRRDIIISHNAFGYMAERYDLDVIPITGVSPEAEPSPARMAQLVDIAKERKATHVFFETLVSPALADTIAKEVGAKTLVLNPLEGLTREEQSKGENYFSIMESNLRNLRLALGCTSG